MALISAYLLALGAQSAQAAALSTPPIVVVSCRVENNGGYGGSVADVHITYKNTYQAPATKVKFSIGYHGQHAYITDSGMFQPNVTISHRFHTFVNQPFLGGKPDCVHRDPRYVLGWLDLGVLRKGVS